MISNSPGTVVDISTEQYRALCMSLFSIAPFNGPVTGPLIGGFIYQAYGWRWDNWLVLILGAVAFGLMFTVRETYAPAILRAKRSAGERRRETIGGGPGTTRRPLQRSSCLGRTWPGRLCWLSRSRFCGFLIYGMLFVSLFL